MEIIWLSKTDKEIYGADCMVKYDYTDVAAATSGVAAPSPLSVLAGTKVQCVGHILDTAFDITGTGALTTSIGDGGSTTALMAAIVTAVDGTEILYHVGGSAKVYLADDVVDFFFTDAGGMTYTTGAARAFFRVEDMNKWAKA